jgi:hypothetical protein
MTQRAPSERRKHARVALRWAVSFRRPGSPGLVRVETHDISSAGFLCLSPAPFSPGETVECTMSIPNPDTPGQYHQLHCHCTVLRAGHTKSGLYAVACHIDDYSLSSGEIN